MSWTTARRTRAIELWKDGRSFLQIARALGDFDGYHGEGRSAVAGFIKRTRTPPKPPKKRQAFSGRQPHPKSVLAAAIVLNALDEAMDETGLNLLQVMNAVRLARKRDRYEQRQMEARDAA